MLLARLTTSGELRITVLYLTAGSNTIALTCVSGDHSSKPILYTIPGH